MLWYQGLNPLPRGRCRLLLSRTPPPFSVTRQRPSAGHTQAPVVAYTVFGYCIKCHSLVMASQPRRLCQGKTVNQLRHYELKPDSLIMIDTRHFLLDCLLSVSVCLSVSLSLCVCFSLCVSLSVSFSLSLSLSVSLSLSICLSVCLSLCLSVSLSLSLSLSLARSLARSLSVCLSVSVSLSFSVSVSLSVLCENSHV